MNDEVSRAYREGIPAPITTTQLDASSNFNYQPTKTNDGRIPISKAYQKRLKNNGSNYKDARKASQPVPNSSTHEPQHLIQPELMAQSQQTEMLVNQMIYMYEQTTFGSAQPVTSKYNESIVSNS